MVIQKLAKYKRILFVMHAYLAGRHQQNHCAARIELLRFIVLIWCYAVLVVHIRNNGNYLATCNPNYCVV